MKPASPIFLERHGYRRRRVADAARLLPLVGAVLLVLPLLWGGGEEPMRTATGVVYLFGVWFVLIVVAALLARPLADAQTDRTGGAEPR